MKYISKKSDKQEVLSTKTKEIDIPELKTVDTSMGLSHMAQNKKLYMKILYNFYNSYKDVKFENLDEAEFNIQIHSIKGLSANIGANNLHIVTKELYESKDRALLSKFYTDLNRVLDELKDKLETTQEEFNTLNLKLSTEKRDELFEALRIASSKRRSRECNQIIDKIQQYKLLEEDKSLLLNIKKLIQNRKFKEAEKILGE